MNYSRFRHLLLCVSITVSLGAPSSGQARPQSAMPAGMTVRQTVEVKRFEQFVWSRNGKWLAFVVRHDSIALNDTQAVVYVMQPDGVPRALVSGTQISNLNWSDDGLQLFYLKEDDGKRQIWAISLTGGNPRQITHNPSGVAADISNREWLNSVRIIEAKSNYLVYYSRRATQALSELEAAKNASVMYTEDNLASELIMPNFAWQRQPSAAQELWSVDLRTGIERLIWRSPVPPIVGGARQPWFAMSPDGSRVGLIWEDRRDRSGPAKGHLTVVDLRSGEQRTLVDLRSGLLLSWEKEDSLTFTASGKYDDRNGMEWGEPKRFALNPSDGSMKQVSGSLFGSEPTDFEDVVRAAGYEVTDCKPNEDISWVACIAQSPTIPPEMALVRFDHGRVVSLKKVTNENSDLAKVSFGRVVQFGPKNGRERRSGYILPVGYKRGNRYPLLVIQYNQFRKYQFSGRLAFNSYPAQGFAAAGFVVLIQNLPSDIFEYPSGDFLTAKTREASSVSGELSDMVDELAADGLIDKGRMGIMGWSWGGYFTPYILAHNPDQFQVGAEGEGGNHDPVGYFMGNVLWKRQEQAFFGAEGPFGKNAANWSQTSPVFLAKNIRAPLLMEYSQSIFYGLALFHTMTDNGDIVELNLYQNEDHVFQRPRNIETSMRRHIDWFSFWLLGREPSDNSDGRSGRWRDYRDKYCRLDKRFPTLCRGYQ